jgi:hypothetical protein
MSRTLPVVVALLTIPLLQGCDMLAPGSPPVAYVFPRIGDQVAVELGEVVVSLPYRGSSAPYQNLHATIAVLVNPIDQAGSGGYGSYSNDNEIEWQVDRLQDRMLADISEQLSGAGEQSAESTPSLRAQIIDHAQKILADQLNKSDDAKHYRVEVVLTSLYWTDASIGMPPKPQRNFGMFD